MGKKLNLWIVGEGELTDKINAQFFYAASVRDIHGKLDGVIFTQPPDDDWITPVQELRKNSAYFFTPVFFKGDLPIEYRSLYDGPADRNMSKKIANIAERVAQISKENQLSDYPDIHFLSYIYSRPNYIVEGMISHRSINVFDYPLIRILFNAAYSFDGWQFLNNLVMRDLLEANEAQNEIQTCPSCSSGLFNLYICCPRCHDNNIRHQKLVHCYACGKIGAVPEFLREERLICSRCNVRLREEGVDYDKPKEDKLCMHCGHHFNRPELRFICLVCKHTTHLEDLDTRHLRAYSIKRRGEFLVRGIEKNIYKNFNQYFKVIDVVEFAHILNWQLKLAQRYEPLFFSIMNIRFNFDEDMANPKELAQVEKLMGELFANLRDVLRESDLSMRLDGDLYFLLPMTDDEGGQRLLNRIQQLISVNPIKDGPAEINLQLSYITSEMMILSKTLDSEAVFVALQDKTSKQQQFYLKE